MASIDIDAITQAAISKTEVWANEAGYVPVPQSDVSLSPKARDLARILRASNFGCQQRQVRLLVQTIIGETLPDTAPAPVNYRPGAKLVPGVFVATTHSVGDVEPGRVGEVVNLSKQGNAALRLSNGFPTSSHRKIEHLRPASSAEIERYFAEFYRLELNPDDQARQAEMLADADASEMPF